ncbi:MAG: bifunctional 2-C-methyl-D-erythritol 4-phosphate cytidylyltransferase/2-C-methyl-D-erythritol 2,4-cyclodiphosphate synthase [Rhizobiaceae bacterium]|nr:bifunctional 2-C-methyl-D-erythritol 4-phosphate cytidylyltransferase/2-C-methyl-D-erythritol 2,4-cyclodiphosphate synthase [Rhizobiaceae bacterium]MCV0406431.1 bifunctional 2-C-methyl-D-erythritol 4-phosphate cytidylyltransferase/2-C-methyl-D-erythritol 2,4-cyclodiphosphate synthase [Rhizobiaceae bacterium]
MLAMPSGAFYAQAGRNSGAFMNPELQGKVGVVIVAAGRGERAGGPGGGPKQYRSIGGRAILDLTIERFVNHPRIGPIVVVIHADDEELFHTTCGPRNDRIGCVIGGMTRQASTLAGLEWLERHEPEIVLIHDGVRPFIDASLLDRVVDSIGPAQGAVPALPVSDTLKRVTPDGLVAETVPRGNLFAAQTPQGFPYDAILEAHRRAASEGRDLFTDDAAIAEWAGITVRTVEGSTDNLKITWPEDLAMADERLAERRFFPDVRTGNGYDVHSFEAGDQVTLCGIAIPYRRRLSGHSDADVGLHALTDALLATCGGGDIGVHFPPSDSQWKGAASTIFVEHAVRLVREKGGRIANADVTLICEAPRIAPHRDAMTSKMAAMLGIEHTRVSVKATTNERLGFIGREEGIAAIATATVVYPGDLPE